jgi:two-component system cell cycle response regulator
MRESILIIDDSPNLHKLIRTYLEGEPHVLHSAYNGLDGLTAATSLLPDLVLLDLDMPDLDGFEVCRRLKANPITQSLPIIFLTGDVSATKQVKGLDLGANDYMTKRFKPEELRARIRSALRVKPLLNDVAMVDGLTKLWNRTYFDLHLPVHLSASRRYDRPLSCVIADIDRLGRINRNAGDNIGDEVLRSAAQILACHTRGEDVLCYLGNGKFGLLLPGIDQAQAARLAEDVRADLEKQLKNSNGVAIEVTCSFGVADTMTGSDSSLLDRADASLYSAKHSGRNSVSLSQPKRREVA